ncbi:hypothetical protein ACHAQJ_007974 [Trichoderma viride]
MAALGNFDNVSFLSLSTLLSICQGPQEPQGHDDAASDAESLDGEDRDAVSEKDSVTPHELSRLDQKEKQLVKFLNHVAETFAREKSVPWSQIKRHERRNGTKIGRGASHVAASGMVTVNGDPTVYVAKNGGVDDMDEGLARYFTIWMRTMAATGRRPTIDKDIMWTKLVDYSRQRLDIYAAQIGSLSQPELTVIYVQGSDGHVLARELHDLSVKYKMDRSLDLLEQMISISYKLRYEPTPDLLSTASKRVRSTVCLLGRLRSAYEAFKETAIQLQRSFTKLIVICLQSSPALLLTKSQCEKRIEELARANGLSKPKKERLLKVLGKETHVLAPFHAEIQLLVHFECSISPDAGMFPYFGCSKKPCWLCHQLLSLYKAKRLGKAGFYETRSCHGRVYPLWSITLPVDLPPNCHARFYLATALQDIQQVMVQRLRTASHIQRPAVAESSANVTVNGGSLRRRALAKQRVAESSAKPESAEDSLDILKDLVCSRECLRIPATSETPHLQSINFYKFPDGYIRREPRNFKIPHLGAFWGVHNFERANRRITLADQDPAELNGDYLVYWCLNDALPPNKNLMLLLGIESLGISEYFWYGDVFITRFHEHDKTFEFSCEDVPRSILGRKGVIKNIFQEQWDTNYLEDEITGWQYLEAVEKKIKADREVLLARMSSTERKMLKKMPGMLDYLTITSCDDGALIDASLEECRDDPEQVMVNTVYRQAATDQIGWKGFSSDNL